MKGSFVLKGDEIALADERMNNPTIKNFFRGFCLGAREIRMEKGEKGHFRIGSLPYPTLPEGKEFAFCVDAEGIAVTGRDYGGLVRGLFSLLMRVEYADGIFSIPFCFEESAYTAKKRMIHICIFPENDLHYIKKLVRLAGACQFTHVILEFWGMLHFDCMKELAWPHAFTKDEAAEIISEIREMGMEPVPMFNQLGHATASRIRSGKHVVLDQNPLLQDYFTPDGWAWNIHSEKVYDLLRRVRAELCDLFGDGEFLHIGCDEAYYYTASDKERGEMPSYLARLTEEVVKEGRRPMIWMDMLLERGKYPDATATCKPEEVEILQGSLHPKSVLVDWQYRVKIAPLPTLLSLKGRAQDVMGAPWLDRENYEAVCDTVTEHDLYGVMLTTWHTLKENMHGIVGCAKYMGAKTFPWSEFSRPRTETATLLRRVNFEGDSYPDTGWMKEQIDL